MKYCGPNLAKYAKKNGLESKLVEKEDAGEDGMVDEEGNEADDDKYDGHSLDHERGKHGSEHAHDDMEEFGLKKGPGRGAAPRSWK